jgi:hypothetical protein
MMRPAHDFASHPRLTGKRARARRIAAWLAGACTVLAALGIGAGLAGLPGGGRVRAQPADSSAAPGAQPQDSGDKLAWGTDFATWIPVTGYILSRSHGYRLAEIRARPRAAAEVHMHNGQLVRHSKEGFHGYPVGTILAMQTWEVGPDLSRGAPGPLFFMRKEAPGYDPDGGDWRYAMTRPDLTVLAEGKDGRVTECRTCHLTMRARDYVPATDR